MIDHAMTGMPLPKNADSGNSAANDSIDEEKYENPDKVSGEWKKSKKNEPRREEFWKSSEQEREIEFENTN